MIDNDGEWAKVEGHQWFRRHVSKVGIKASFSKRYSPFPIERSVGSMMDLSSFRSRFRLTRHLDKKLHTRRKISEPVPPVQPLSKLPRLTDCQSSTFFLRSIDRSTFRFVSAIPLSPVPENDDCPTSMISSSALISGHSFRDRIRLSMKLKKKKSCDEESNYATMPAQEQGEYSTVDIETERSLANDLHAGGSVIVRVPTMFRRDDDTGTITDAAESIYNQNYTLPSAIEGTSLQQKPSIIVGHCQARFQPLDPKLLIKPMRKSTTFDQHEFEHCSQSFHVSSYDSGFVDDSNLESIATTSTGIVCPESEMHGSAEKHRPSKRRVSFQGETMEFLFASAKNLFFVFRSRRFVEETGIVVESLRNL